MWSEPSLLRMQYFMQHCAPAFYCESRMVSTNEDPFTLITMHDIAVYSSPHQVRANMLFVNSKDPDQLLFKVAIYDDERLWSKKRR